MDTLDLARWQFAITTVYHFLFVPMTIGMSAIVAGFNTWYVRTHRPELLRLTKLFGTILTINVALGLVTGIVQEFQFGMNWSAYSKFIGDILGAPLALEALLAFFVESVFLGMWIFGWGRIPEKIHCACMWVVHIGTMLSAYFILAANSFMQHPVGYTLNPATGRAELTDFWAVLTNEVQLVTFPHVVAGAYMVAGALVMCVGIYLMRKTVRTAESADSTDTTSSAVTDTHDSEDDAEHDSAPATTAGDRSMYRLAARVGAVIVLIAGLGVSLSGDAQGKVMTRVQPMKMAAAEALFESPPKGQCADFSVLTVGNVNATEHRELIKIPCLLSYLGTGSFDGEVKGIDELKVAYQQRYGAHPNTASPSYVPNIPLAYWNFRFMITAGMFSVGVALLALWFLRKDRNPMQKWWGPLLVITPLGVVLAHSFGWIFTEIGRQPWVVWGVLTTQQGVSPDVSTTEIWVSMSAFTLLYAVLAVIEVKLLMRYIRRGAPPYEPIKPVKTDEDRLAFSY